MNTGQMFLVVGAFVLLSTISVSVNRYLLDSDRVLLEAQAGTVAVSLAQGRAEELTALPFDSLAVGAWTDTIATAYAAFGCSTRVDYVEAGAPDSPVAGPTRLKRVQVVLSGGLLLEKVKLEAVSGNF